MTYKKITIRACIDGKDFSKDFEVPCPQTIKDCLKLAAQENRKNSSIKNLCSMMQVSIDKSARGMGRSFLSRSVKAKNK